MKISTRSIILVTLALAALRSLPAQTPVSALPIVNFKDTFPWKVWVSSEGRDSTYPAGFHYKLLSVRNADSTIVDFALVRELPDGSKVVAIHANGPLAKFDATTAHVLETLSKSFNITFQLFDLSDVRTFEEFQTRAADLGWGVYGPTK